MALIPSGQTSHGCSLSQNFTLSKRETQCKTECPLNSHLVEIMRAVMCQIDNYNRCRTIPESHLPQHQTNWGH
ncbi:hypothetical protein PAXRUDRAFT_289121 [Paxillus rubicundulus Ve08.2h10]|uniref:Uncharacterized protein n=1 Tax=Paxillus rubicundulus Ve08.2h10 TaxID=930991 RepID=A0A0D0E5M1_9AGAM|nr:hypothetical protein PAXRUDRAFT_289121 [Paxillus rubicundulus Ve08.2h10]